MELITRDKANEIAAYHSSRENAIFQAIEFVNDLIIKESNKGNFKITVLCSQFNQFKCKDELHTDVCKYVIEELRDNGYKVTEKYCGDLLEVYLSISWE